MRAPRASNGPNHLGLCALQRDFPVCLVVKLKVRRCVLAQPVSHHPHPVLQPANTCCHPAKAREVLQQIGGAPCARAAAGALRQGAPGSTSGNPGALRQGFEVFPASAPSARNVPLPRQDKRRENFMIATDNEKEARRCLPLRFRSYSLPFHCLSLAFSLPFTAACHCLLTAFRWPSHCLSLTCHCRSTAFRWPSHCLSLTCHCRLSLPFVGLLTASP